MGLGETLSVLALIFRSFDISRRPRSLQGSHGKKYGTALIVTPLSSKSRSPQTSMSTECNIPKHLSAGKSKSQSKLP
jgi:hypothetical protein